MRSPDGTAGISGSITLFIAAIILPLIFFIFSLSIDLRSYVSLQQRAQKALDETGLYAYRFINSIDTSQAVPPVDIAVSRAFRYLEKYPDIAHSTSVSRNGDMLSLEFRGGVPMRFASLLSGFFNSSGKISLPVHARTRVRGTVFDSVIAVDRSYYLAPPVSAPDSEAWGDPQTWPASSLFGEKVALSVPPRIATQQCFNPSFSALKMAAIESYNALRLFSLNRTALAFFPGGYGPLTVVRTLARPASPPEADFEEASVIVSDSGDQLVNDEKIFQGDKVVSRSVVENRFCAAVAESRDSPRGYWFPDRRETASDPLGGRPPMIGDDWIYDPGYDNLLMGSDVIWSRAIISRTEGGRKEPATPQVIEALLPVIFASGSRPERGGLKNRAVRTILLLAGDVPRAGGTRFGDSNDESLREELRNSLEPYKMRLKNWNAAVESGGDPAALRIYYILYQPEFSNLQIEPWRLSTLSDFFEQESLIDSRQMDYFRIHFTSVKSSSDIASGITGMLLLEQKAGVLSW